jgi:hypothetical protein
MPKIGGVLTVVESLILLFTARYLVDRAVVKLVADAISLRVLNRQRLLKQSRKG